MDGTLIPHFILRYSVWIMIPIWVLHMAQRRSRDAGERKRLSTLLLTLVPMCFWGAAWVYARLHLADLWFLPLFFLAAMVIAWQRRRFWPYRLHCLHCGAPLPLKTIFYVDSNSCDACSAALKPAEEPPSGGQGDQP